VTLCLRPGSSTRKVVAAAKGQEIPVQRVTSWTAECDRRGRDVDDSVNVIDVDPLPRDSSADIWFVAMVGGNNFDPRARYLANIMRRHLRGEHRTGDSNVSVSVRLDMSLSTSGPQPNVRPLPRGSMGQFNRLFRDLPVCSIDAWPQCSDQRVRRDDG
jgi:hypothetical protein